MRITTIRHPDYVDTSYDFQKWRLTYKGGRWFINKFLKKFSKRETNVAFNERKAISYCPAFAKSAIDKLKNLFYSRMPEITRKDGPESYRRGCAGEGGGVDLFGSSMNAFIGQNVIDEIMTMRQVGVYVDRMPLNGPLLSENEGNAPYLYVYKTEDILSWRYTYFQGEYVYKTILLRDNTYDYDPETGLATGCSTQYRQMWIGDDGYVHMQFWVPDDKQGAEYDTKVGPEIILPLTRIPFVIAGIKESLLSEAADYQIALLNVASSDVNYAWRGNFPIYTEQFDPAATSVHTRRPRPQRNPDRATGQDPTAGTRDEGQVGDSATELEVGATDGRSYPKGMERPGFISPSSEPLMASMKKQEQMIEQIYQLIDVALAAAKPQHASVDSKAADNQGAEAGLSYIGLELEYLEREIAKIWAEYENAEPATIIYPTKYKLKSDQERLDEAKALNEIKSSVPSRQFGKEVGKRITDVMFKDKVDPKIIETIYTEIDKAKFATSDPTVIQIAAELGMVSAETGSDALGFDGKTEVPIAKKEHTEKLAEIAKSQASANPAARGTPSPVAGRKAGAKKEKLNPDGTPKKVRGPASGNPTGNGTE